MKSVKWTIRNAAPMLMLSLIAAAGVQGVSITTFGYPLQADLTHFWRTVRGIPEALSDAQERSPSALNAALVTGESEGVVLEETGDEAMLASGTAVEEITCDSALQNARTALEEAQAVYNETAQACSTGL